MNTTTYGLKSIPLNSLPPEAWRVVVGDNGSIDNSILARYEDVPWLYRGIEARCNALAGMPFAVHKGDESGDELEEGTLPFEVELSDLLNQLYRYYILFGAWYLFIGKNRAKFIKDVRPLHPKTITPKYDEMQGLTHFIRKLGTREITLQVDDMAWLFKPPHKSETGIGISDAMVALKAAGIIHAMDNYERGYFENGAINPTLVSVAPGVQKSDKERLEAWYRRALTGVKNAFKISVIENAGDLKTVSLGYAMKDLAAPELNAQKREDIATALGVPQTVLFSNAANYATALQDDLHFYEKTIVPDALRFERALNNDLFKPLGYCFKFHKERMEIYQRLEAEKSASVVALYDKGIMTLAEVREHMNLPPLPEAEEITVTTEPPKQLPAPEAEMEDEAETNEAEAKLNANVIHVSPLAADLLRWRDKAIKRYGEGKPGKAVDFESEAIPQSLAASIKGALEAIKSADDVRHIFADAMQWVAYP